jgi:DNA-binding CsgD family transcriptional regulator
MAQRHGTGPSSRLDPWPPHWSASIQAAARAADPGPHLGPLVAQFGFDGLSCIALARSASGVERTIGVWSTAPRGWAERYRERGYAGVDPRVTMTAPRLSPVVWDAADADAAAVRRFLADAARFGVRSGFAVSFRDAAQLRIVVAFDSGRSPLTEANCIAVVSRLGELMLLAAALHDRVLRPRFGALHLVGRRAFGLTTRERDCLGMAAQGLTSADIGGRLAIAERTVNFHMRNVLRKLEAQNRAEAIAKALARGVFETAALV